MTDAIAPGPGEKTILQFRARVENGVIVPEEAIDLPAGYTYLVTLQLEPESKTSVDALAEIAAIAQAIGPADLARNFDTYTNQIVDEPAE
jgi:hypothetical protein